MAEAEKVPKFVRQHRFEIISSWICRQRLWRGKCSSRRMPSPKQAKGQRKKRN
jgi:hypothetical protein